MGVVSLMNRVWNVITGRATEIVDKLERPEDQLRLFVTQLDKEMSQMRESVVLAMTEEKKMKASIESSLLKSQEWEKKAVYALGQGQEDLAREALERKGECDAIALRLKSEWDKQAAAVQALKKNMQSAQVKAEAAKREYTLVLARYKSAQATQNVSRQLNQAQDGAVAGNLEALNAKILKIEAQTEAEVELGSLSNHSDFDERFIEIEKKIKGDDALAELKAKMSSGSQLMIEAKRKA